MDVKFEFGTCFSPRGLILSSGDLRGPYFVTITCFFSFFSKSNSFINHRYLKPARPRSWQNLAKTCIFDATKFQLHSCSESPNAERQVMKPQGYQYDSGISRFGDINMILGYQYDSVISIRFCDINMIL